MKHKQDVQKKLDELGILNIEAYGELSSEIIQDAITSTEKLLSSINLADINAEITKKEKDLL